MATWHLSENGVARPTSEPELYQLATAGRWDCFACSELTQNQWVPLATAMHAIAQRPPAPPPPPPPSAPRAAGAPPASGAVAPRPRPDPAPHEPPPARDAPVLTYSILALCVAAFIVEIVADVAQGHGAETMTGFNTLTLLSVGADQGLRTDAGEPWRLISAMFLHANLLHIASNMYCFIGAGALAERLFGRARFAGVYLLAGIGGGVLSDLWKPMVASIGASGAIFGVLGALVAFFILRRHDFTPESLKAQQSSLLTCILLNVGFGMTSPVINNAAHVGGLIFGFLGGLALTPPREETDATRARAVAATIGVVALLGGGFALDSWRVARDPRVAFLHRLEKIAPAVEKISKANNALDGTFARFYAITQQKPAPSFTELGKPSASMLKQVEAETATLEAIVPPDQDCADLRTVALARATHLAAALRAIADGRDDAETVKTYLEERDAFIAAKDDYLAIMKRIVRPEENGPPDAPEKR